MSAERALFLSLRPRFADLLVSGQKRVELRRVRPRANPGTLVVVYAASPRREIVGTCLVEAIGDATPEEIWRLHGPETGLRLPDFRAYFDGARRAVAITITRPHRLDPPTPLAQVRAAWLGFQPPQSFRYVPLADALDLVGACDTGSASTMLSPILCDEGSEGAEPRPRGGRWTAAGTARGLLAAPASIDRA